MNTRADEKTRRAVLPSWLTVVFMGSGLGPFGPPRNDTVVPCKICALQRAVRRWKAAPEPLFSRPPKIPADN